MTADCGVAALLRASGPVRVPLRECCVAALVGADGAVTSCAAAASPTPTPAGPVVPAPPWQPVEVTR
ncbi:hypothetical protein [Actinoplanes sp. CA-252034]|uniref:hypothetical protein n=1 Tax=Actinoplanes sp. CA-252034 TaxID=3239906 RepID=UPI003D955A39